MKKLFGALSIVALCSPFLIFGISFGGKADEKPVITDRPSVEPADDLPVRDEVSHFNNAAPACVCDCPLCDGKLAACYFDRASGLYLPVVYIDKGKAEDNLNSLKNRVKQREQSQQSNYAPQEQATFTDSPNNPALKCRNCDTPLTGSEERCPQCGLEFPWTPATTMLAPVTWYQQSSSCPGGNCSPSRTVRRRGR